jgi:hypothetical protein
MQRREDRESCCTSLPPLIDVQLTNPASLAFVYVICQTIPTQARQQQMSW